MSVIIITDFSGGKVHPGTFNLTQKITLPTTSWQHLLAALAPIQATGQNAPLSSLPCLCPKYSTPSASCQLPLQESLEALASFLLQDELSLQTFNPHSSCPGRSLHFSFQIAHFLQLHATPPTKSFTLGMAAVQKCIVHHRSYGLQQQLLCITTSTASFFPSDSDTPITTFHSCRKC